MSKCENLNCSASSGFDGGITFGSGILDPYGYWQFPCRVCAEDFDTRKEETRKEIRQQMLAEGRFPLDVVQYIVNTNWHNLPAWPRADQDVEQLIKDGVVYFARLAEEEKELEREQEEFGWAAVEELEELARSHEN